MKSGLLTILNSNVLIVNIDMEKVKQFDDKSPFEKVVIFDEAGNQSIIGAYKIVIQMGDKEYCIENYPYHIRKPWPRGLNIHFNCIEDRPRYFAIYPLGNNMIHLSIHSAENNDGGGDL